MEAKAFASETMSPALPVIDYASHPAYGAMFQPDEALAAEALGILQPLIDEMAEVEADRNRKFGYRYGHASPVGEALAKRAISHLQLTGKTFETLHANAQPVIKAMQDRIGALRAAGKPIRFKTVEQGLTKEANGELWRSVDAMLREMEIYDVVAAFFGAGSARINSLAMFVNPANQDWASRPFRDIDLQAPPTAGFHIDSNGKCYLKGILYLSDVGPEQGPFGIVPESHLWGQGGVDRIRRRAFDRSPLISRSAEERQVFVSLPKDLQVKAEFGGDMVPGSAESDRLLQQELVSIGPRGLLSLFYPEAIHRGGNVSAGERHALQITLTAQW
jgi:hypothetical protein